MVRTKRYQWCNKLQMFIGDVGLKCLSVCNECNWYEELPENHASSIKDRVDSAEVRR